MSERDSKRDPERRGPYLHLETAPPPHWSDLLRAHFKGVGVRLESPFQSLTGGSLALKTEKAGGSHRGQ